MAKILIVEDEILIADNAQTMLENLGYIVVGIESTGLKAIASAKETQPDLILMDIMIKGDMDGIKTANIIKEQFAIPIIYVTAYEDTETLERAQITEPYGYLLKPLKERELKATIKMALYKHSVDLKLVETVSTLRDSEERFRESEERFKAIFDYSSDGIDLVDPVTKNIVLFNKRFQEMLGYSEYELQGMNIMKIHPKEDWEWIAKTFKKAMEHPHIIFSDIPVLRKDRTVFYADISSYSCVSITKPFVVGNFRDTTERKLFEERLNNSVQFSKNIVESSMDMIVVTDKDGKIAEFNHSAQLRFQYRMDEIIGKSISSLFQPIENSIDVFDETIKRGKFSTEAGTICKDGAVFISAITSAVMFDLKSEVSGLVCVMRDITEQKKNEQVTAMLIKELSLMNEELQKSKEQLVQSEKMASLGQLVAGVAHEINTPIGIALTSSSRLVTLTKEIAKSIENETMKKSDFDKYLSNAEIGNDLVIRNLKRTADLIRSFKMVSADQTSQERRRFNLKSYIEDIIISLRPKLQPSKHVIEVQCADDIEIDNNPGAFAQIMTNLIMNSLMHGFEECDNGQMIISCRQINDMVLIKYSDNGKGIPRENLTKIFDPFFTTRRGSGGTGLGLNIVYNIVTQNLRGTIRCESIEGQGAAFILELPISLDIDIVKRPYPQLKSQ